MVMKECSHVDSPSTSRKISFAGSSAVAGMSEKKTQRRHYPLGGATAIEVILYPFMPAVSVIILYVYFRHIK